MRNQQQQQQQRKRSCRSRQICTLVTAVLLAPAESFAAQRAVLGAHRSLAGRPAAAARHLHAVFHVTAPAPASHVLAMAAAASSERKEFMPDRHEDRFHVHFGAGRLGLGE
jgi:hypothetical protein